MKILHINYSDSKGGAATSVRRLHASFLKHNYDSWLFVTHKFFSDKNVFTFDNSFDKINNFVKKLFSKIFCKFFKIFNHNTDYSISYFSSNIKKYINKTQPSIINLHWICNETLSIEEVPKINKPLVWTILDMWPFLGAQHIDLEQQSQKYWNNKNYKDNFFFDINSWVFKRKLNSFNFDFELIAISNWLADKAKESVLFQNKKISVIPCLLDFDQWCPLEKKEARKKLNLNFNKKFILFSSAAGSSDQKKGFKYLIKILKNCKNVNDFHLILIGKLNKKDLEGLNISYSQFNNFLFGDPKILTNIYSCADLVIMPSIVEAFGQVALEAAACNVPTLAFNNTGLQEIIKHKTNGYLADYLNEEDLSYGFNWCLNDENNKLISSNCRIMAVKKFSDKVIIPKYNNIYQKLI
jgi:glycosyltransferase involved in cell wall biosynthesis